MIQRLLFIGVSTGGSSIMELWPRWASFLDIDAEIAGRDIAIGAGPSRYRNAVEEIADDDLVRGALVTTHKMSVFRHAGDLFEELDPLAIACREVSCISKRQGALIGHAKDPVTAGLAMDHMLGEHYWEDSDAEVLCLGAGGAGAAITVRLLTQSHGPRRIRVSDVDEARLESLREIHAGMEGSSRVDYEKVGGSEANDALMKSLPPRSLVVNATGRGKDTPGSPVTAAASWPERGVAWDLNYRGKLDFLTLAHREAPARKLTVHDGWRYFLHGWSEVVGEIFGLPVTPGLFDELAREADSLRPSAAG